MVNIRKYPFTKQEETKDCAAACLHMIIDYYKGHLSMEKIRKLLKIDSQGTTAFHIVEGAKKIGFESKGVKCNLDDINEDNIILPCIANVIINNTYRHFVVIYKIDFDKRTLLIADPSNKIMKMSFDIFKSIFSGVIIILYPNDNIPYENKKKLKLNLLIFIIKSHPKLIKQLSILSILVTFFSILSSFFLEELNLSITIYNTKDIVVLVLLIFVSLSFIKCLSKYFREKILIYINEKINLKFTLDTFKKILLLPYEDYHNKTTGDIVTRILDVGIIKETSSRIFLILLIDIPLALCAVVILLMLNYKLLLLSLIILILYIIVIFIFKDYFDSSISKIKKKNIDVTNYTIESIKNFETVKGLKIFNRIYSRFEKKFVDLLNSDFKYENMLCLQNFLKSLINECGLIMIYGIGAIIVVKGELSFSSLLSFGALLNYFFEPIQNLVSLESDFRKLDLVLGRLNELNEEITSSGITDEFCKGDIIISNLNYTYNDKKDILKGLSLNIKGGEKVIILGKSGSGKSTLVKILMKYYLVKRGTIFINNIDINDYIYTNGMLYISQSENLFTDSLYNNLTLYKPVSINKILEVSKICEIENIIKSNTLGYNMLIEENSSNISGGEKQRIVLARSLLNNFNILIIDEGLNQVDIDLERKILKNLFNKYKNKTILVISHRTENLDLYDRKLVIEDGELICNATKV